MAVGDADRLWEAIPVLEAQEMLLQMKAADWPNMNKAQRDKHSGQVVRQSNPFMRERSITDEELQRVLAG